MKRKTKKHNNNAVKINDFLNEMVAKIGLWMATTGNNKRQTKKKTKTNVKMKMVIITINLIEMRKPKQNDKLCLYSFFLYFIFGLFIFLRKRNKKKWKKSTEKRQNYFCAIWLVCERKVKRFFITNAFTCI